MTSIQNTPKIETLAGSVVCPDWAFPFWNSQLSDIVECADGTFAVVDFSLGCETIYSGTDKVDCILWMGPAH